MSRSGGTPGWLPPAAGHWHMAGGEGGVGNLASTAGALRLYPVWLPFGMTVTQVGVNVTAAGAAGCTVQPAVYKVGPNGDPAGLQHAGPLLSGAAIGFVSAADAFQLAPGWWWMGALVISAGAAPTITSMGRVSTDPRGSIVPTDSPAGATQLSNQSGLAALPDPFAGTYVAGTSPMLYLST